MVDPELILERLKKINQMLYQVPALDTLESVIKATEIIEAALKELRTIGCYLTVQEQMAGYRNATRIPDDNKRRIKRDTR